MNTHPFLLDAPDATAGVLMSHGFTGSPASLRPWGEYLYRAGLTVTCPLLPGHGTIWQDLNKTTWHDWYGTVERSLLALVERMDGRPVFAMGLSMGGTLVSRLAEQHGHLLQGIVLVNPSFTTLNKAAVFLPILSRVLPAISGIVNDIKKPGAISEGGYDRTPLRALNSLRQFWRLTRNDLGKITVPILVFRSTVDHVVEPENTQILLRGVSSTSVTQIVLHNSYHVATLDNDAERIFSESLSFVREQFSDQG